MNIHPDTAKAMLVAGQISQEDYEALTVKPKNKYNAQKTEVDGVTFASKREANRYSQLKMLERGGEIKDLRLQVKFGIVVEGVKICDYIADYCYYDTRSDNPIIEDCKGFRTPVYRLKAKLVLAIYGIRITET